MSVAKTRVAVLISGTGSNMASLIAAGQAADAPYEVVVVVSNIAGAGGLTKAEAAGVEALTVEHKPFGKDREAHERAIDALLAERGVQVVALAGYMRLLTPWLVGKWADRMLNIHPSLLPSFRGADAHVQALAAGVRVSGCTVHLVRPEMDTGPILLQGLVPVLPGDTVEALSRRTLEVEHVCYPRALELMASGRVTVEAGRVAVEGIAAERLLVRHPLLGG